MRNIELIEGLQILQQYRDKPNGFDIGADHDVIYAYRTDRPLSAEHILRLIELGWHQEHDERNYNDDFALKDYRQEESWRAYT